MKQLLLRVDDDLHARLTERAKRERRSVNAIANEILSVVGEGDGRTASERVRARAAALGMLAPPLKAVERHDRPVKDVETLRAEVLDSMRGVGEILDGILDEDRDRLL
ncbi:toxin-antitoxin system HicB family antitoxin [Glycomyces sp. TRM65418]|uniref:toxin-antitoxin system HicB family antitoxin n=1 Tax=Glycomyces sp. TRM65418 TaxID=2867006 RepID=UPI001CE61052|nr:toxin-antitoxin system HicB family antitoxin [Glycomyces sp. TRM65418]MCC3764839.1 toxin-antitoxin system HicB family antitoxin [Glycomyces sp. TRM65418]QZD54487.1 toxin-antitoxin system HicB family antitoxin [Glycomyces sp. TRM65418]